MSDIAALQDKIAARQAALSGTVDELASRVTPAALLEQSRATLTQRVTAVTHTPEGDLRVERVAVIAGVVIALVVLRVWGGRRRRARRG